MNSKGYPEYAAKELEGAGDQTIGGSSPIFAQIARQQDAVGELLESVLRLGEKLRPIISDKGGVAEEDRATQTGSELFNLISKNTEGIEHASKVIKELMFNLEV